MQPCRRSTRLSMALLLVHCCAAAVHSVDYLNVALQCTSRFKCQICKSVSNLFSVKRGRSSSTNKLLSGNKNFHHCLVGDPWPTTDARLSPPSAVTSYYYYSGNGTMERRGRRNRVAFANKLGLFYSCTVSNANSCGTSSTSRFVAVSVIKVISPAGWSSRKMPSTTKPLLPRHEDHPE